MQKKKPFFGTIVKTKRGIAIKGDDGIEYSFLPQELQFGNNFQPDDRITFEKCNSLCPGRFLVCRLHKLTYAEALSNPSPHPRVVIRPPMAAAAIPPPPMPKSIVGSTLSAATFFQWVKDQAQLVKDNSGLRFVFGQKYPLTDGTMSIPISISRLNQYVQNTSFVFHYHPGANGPSVGNGFASRWHFKPTDGANKTIRIEEHQFQSIPGDLCRNVKHLAH